MKLCLLTTAAVIALAGMASADETLKFRHVQHATSWQSQDVGNGHVLSVYRLPGIALFPDGSIGSTVVVGESDIANGTGPLNGYYSVTTADGSTLSMKYTGEMLAGKNSPRKGTAIIIGGTGRFKDAKGTGTWEGAGTPPGADVISYIDNVITISCPNAGCATN